MSLATDLLRKIPTADDARQRQNSTGIRCISYRPRTGRYIVRIGHTGAYIGSYSNLHTACHFLALARGVQIIELSGMTAERYREIIQQELYA